MAAFPFKPFSARQLQVITAPADRYILFAEGAVRSGKTIALGIKWLDFVNSMPKGSAFLMSGRTRESLKNNVINDLKAINGTKAFTYKEQKGELYINGRFIRCVGAHDEDDFKAIQGATFCGWYADEVALHPKSFVDMARTRVSADPGFVLWSCNPEGPFHYIHQEYLEEGGEGYGDTVRLSFKLEDNLALSRGYIDQLMRSFKGLFFRRYILGEWVLAEGVIYSGFDLAGVHGFDVPPGFFDFYLVALDYGTQNPFHALLIGFRAGVGYVLREFRHSGLESKTKKTNAQYSRALRAWLGRVKPRRIFVDPSATSFIQQLRVDGFAGVTEAANDVINGIQTVDNWMMAGKLLFSRKHVPYLARELGTYSWDPKKALKGEDVPIKRADHGPDALRYAMHSQFGEVTTTPTGLSVVKKKIVRVGR